ncbi:MAG: serine/threonine-protein kinase, partial [Polyangiales bacterium]
GEYYLTMEYLIGEPLSRVMNHVRRGPEDASPGQALRMALVIAEACAGLHVAHELKGLDGRSLEVVHRDVTPRNLFLNYDGTVKIVDFGIASARLHLHSKPTDEIRGNVAYMAPEQLMGASSDRRADVWALGVTFWEMLATRRLFKRDTPMSTVLSVIYDEIPPPSAERPQVPKALDDIVLRALQRNPERRWQSAEEMRQAIRRFLDSESEILGPADLSEWMAALFPNGEARKKELIEMALRAKPEGTRRIPEGKE